MKRTIWLIDIDGTVCEDVPNEEAHRFDTASPLPGALEKVKELYDRGDRVTFFTSRTSEHAEVTERWLNYHGFHTSLSATISRVSTMEKCTTGLTISLFLLRTFRRDLDEI